MSATDAVNTELATMPAGCTTCRSWPSRTKRLPPRRPTRLVRAGNASPGEAVVEVWQYDALGRYSRFLPPDDSAVVTADTVPRTTYLPDQSFLRGRQGTDGDGTTMRHSGPAASIAIARTTQQQVQVLIGAPVSLDYIRPSDLIFTQGHRHGIVVEFGHVANYARGGMEVRRGPRRAPLCTSSRS